MTIEKLISIAKSKLGHPSVELEITDEMFHDLLSEAYSQFRLYSKLTKELSSEKLHQIEENWIGQYFFALVKESAGNIRGKFSGSLKVPGADLKLDYLHLLKEAEAEKKALIKILYSDYDYENNEEIALIASYVNVGNLPEENVERLCQSVAKSFKETMPAFIKFIIIPIKDKQSYLELVFSNVDSSDTKKINELYQQLRDLDSELDKYLPNTDEK